MQKAYRQFFLKDVVTLAEDLIGCKLVRYQEGKKLSLRIVETEAYRGPEDKACHACGGKRTKRTEPMFWQGGTIYVYLIYGMYYCFNIVAEKADLPQAALIRAGEPLEGIDLMKSNRELSSPEFHEIAGGPGRLCQAIDIDDDFSGEDLLTNPELDLIIEKTDPDRVGRGTRVNIDYAEEYRGKPWRFYDKKSSCVTGL